MARRLLFASRRRSSSVGSALGSSELRSAERDLAHFRRRLVLAGVLVLAAFAGIFGRFVYLQIVRHGHYETLAESNRG